MKTLLLNIKLDGIESVTWGSNDSQKRNNIRKAIKKMNPKFDEQFIEQILEAYTEISIVLNCYLKNPFSKDIDNLAKIPIDAIFYSAKNDSNEYEIGHTNKWESKISSLLINKIKSNENALEVVIYGM